MIRLLSILLVVACSHFVTAQKTEFNSPEVLPVFTGSDQSFEVFARKNLQFPAEAQTLKIKGKVIVRCLLTERGKVAETELVRNIGGGCGAEAHRLVMLSDGMWTPAKQDGKAVSTYMHLPVYFDFETAAVIVTQKPVKVEDGDRTAILFNHGIKNFDEEKYSKARHYFQQVLQLKPMDANARFNLALTKIKLDDSEGACIDFEILAEQDHEDALKMMDKHCQGRK